MYPIYDFEYDLMEYCIKQYGSWWSNHFYRGKKVDGMYQILRRMPLNKIKLTMLNTK